MTTRLRIICCILSTLALGACSAAAGKPQRIVQVQALADASLRARNPGWQREVRDLVEAASDYYEREFGIRFATREVSAWPLRERVPSTADLLARLGKDFAARETNEPYDLIVAFTAEGVSRYLRSGRPRVDRIGNCAQGLSRYVVVPVHGIFRYSGPGEDPALDVVALIHELGHVFGAEHVQDINSIMHEDFGYRTDFDVRNRAVIERNKFCRFAK